MTWRYAAASVAGTSHRREDLPCQDAHSCEIVASQGGDILIAAVSDGAGSASHGGTGAEYVCRTFVSIVDEDLRCNYPPGDQQWLVEKMAQTRAGLLNEAKRRDLPARQLAATMLCAVVSENWSVFGQVGDGAIVAPEAATGDWSWLFWPQRGEYANTTYFLTDPAAMDVLEADVMHQGLTELSLFTDGLQHLVLHYVEQTVHSPFFEGMIAPVRRSSAIGEDKALSEALASYLRSPTVTSRADDDLTLLIASRVEGGERLAGST